MVDSLVVELDPIIVSNNNNKDDNNHQVKIRCFSLSYKSVQVQVCSLGASVSKFIIHNDNNDNDNDNDNNNIENDIVLGYNSPLEQYQNNNPVYFACIVGRVANRIKHGKFTLNNNIGGGGGDDETTTTTTCCIDNLAINNPPNHLHGGIHGYHSKIWNCRIVEITNNNNKILGVEFSYLSLNGDEGYPGTVQVTATYSLQESSKRRQLDENNNNNNIIMLHLDMRAKLIVPSNDIINNTKNDDTLLPSTMNNDNNYYCTPINLAQHSYFNLQNEQSKTNKNNNNVGILNHTLTINADSYTPVNEYSIPTKQVLSLDDDPIMDFRKPRTLRDALTEYGIQKMNYSIETMQQYLQDRSKINIPFGFDHNYVINQKQQQQQQEENKNDNDVTLVAQLEYESKCLTIYSNAPGVQLYTANYLQKEDNDNNNNNKPLYKSKKGYYLPWDGLCLETQAFPNSIEESSNNNPDFDRGKCVILTPDNPTYHHVVEYHVSTSSTSLSKACATSITTTTSSPSSSSSSSGVMYGTDTEGNTYYSIKELWDTIDVDTWYSRAAEYYEENCDATIDGVLGGIGWLSGIDIQGSNDFLQNELQIPLLSSSSSLLQKDNNNNIKLRACECGAGVGRVTKDVLLKYCHYCDLIESSSRLLSTAPEYLGNNMASKCRYYCIGLQNWIPPEPNTYTIIWIQWVLIYLLDDDIVSFLKHCKDGLIKKKTSSSTTTNNSSGGYIILKENTCMEPKQLLFDYDINDASVTRSMSYWMNLINQAGLEVVKQCIQDDFPDSIFPVPMLALQPKKNEI